jgi:predicted nuclease of predicted toxin-antitoxin system
LKILLDHNLDRRLKNSLAEYNTATTQERNWANALNSELLRLAEENGFDVLLTADTNIINQQNLAGRNISVLVLRAFDNRLATHLEMLDDIHRALREINPGEIAEIAHYLVRKNSKS